MASNQDEEDIFSFENEEVFAEETEESVEVSCSAFSWHSNWK